MRPVACSLANGMLNLAPLDWIGLDDSSWSRVVEKILGERGGRIEEDAPHYMRSDRDLTTWNPTNGVKRSGRMNLRRSRHGRLK